MAKKLSIPKEDFEEILPGRFSAKLRLSTIRYISPTELITNDSNKFFFEEESEQYFTSLKQDIEKRGILVPLIAKKDKTLVAGHNRLRIALELGMQTIPVQFVEKDLTEEEEREFLIKDNLLRRHLSLEQRVTLYRTLFPNFDAEILGENRLKGRAKDTDERLTAEKIAEETGQTKESVQKQLQRIRKKFANSGQQKKADNVHLSNLQENCKELAQKIADNIYSIQNYQLLQRFHKTMQYVIAETDKDSGETEDSEIPPHDNINNITL